MSSGRTPPAQTRAAFAARARAEEAEAEARAASLRAAVPDLAEVLYGLGAARVWLFGSLVAGDVHAGSDIDLAVEGLPEGRYFRALGELVGLAPARVDLVELESAVPSMRALILAEGVQVPWGAS